MKLSNVIKIFLIIVITLGLAFVGFKLIKRVIKKPKRFNTHEIINNLQGPSIDAHIKVFAASSLDRIFKDGQTLVKPSFTTDVKIAAARHEYEPFQIIVQAGNETLQGVYLQVSDFTNAAGQTIPSKQTAWYPVGYVQTLRPYYPVKYIGLWPDPLLDSTSVDVKANEFQSFWVSPYVPPQTPAGDYKATVTVKSLNSQPKTIPVTLHVYDFQLPVTSQLKTAFDFYGHMTKVRYPQGERETSEAWHARLDAINEQFIFMMLKYRMNPILNIDPTLDSDLAKVDRYRVYGLTQFSIGKKGGTFDNNWPKDEPSIEALLPTYRAYGEFLKLNRMLDMAYIYTWDEGDMNNPVVPKVASMIHRAYPGLKNMVCYHGLWDPRENPEWGKDLDIWTFQIDDYNEERFQLLQKMGMEMWMYISGPSSTGSPNLVMDSDSIEYRIAPWMAWKYDIKGFLYWCVNWWPTVDPFKNAKNSKWDQNGNGLLFYPGEQGPLPSMRVEVFRDGMEDYEYIQILINELRILKSKQLDNNNPLYDESIKLLTMDDSFIHSFTQFTKDTHQFIARRNAIANQIEKIKASTDPASQPIP